MGELREFLLPDVGEGLTEADVLQWMVAVGETVVQNQILVEIETAKAAVELPSPYAGVVAALLVGEGETAEVGTPIIAIEVAVMDSPATEADEVPPMLVGYGQRSSNGHRRIRHTADHGSVIPAARQPDVEAAVTTAFASAALPLAKPPVRKLAKSLGVALAGLVGTGPDGTITREDVQHAAAVISEAPAPVLPATRDRGGPLEERIPVRGVRRQTATAMVSSAFKAPHVTVFQTVDMSATMALREKVAARREFADVHITPLLFVSRAALFALRRHPYLNASWQDEPNEIVIKRYVNLGFAAATDRGLIVPNVKDADQLSLLELARAINDLTVTARAGQATVADLTGGTFTITNIGVFGIDAGTPILTPGEAAILAFGAVRRQPWVVTRADGSEGIEPRWVTQLSLSFDHRVVDGEQGARFLADVAETLNEPALSVL